MNLKHTFILSLFFILILSAVKAALIQTLDESRVIEVPISKEDLTRITVQEDLVLKIAEVNEEKHLKETHPFVSRLDVENLLEACRSGRIPLGYKEAPLNLYAPQGSYKLIQELKGDTLRCLTYEVKNSLQSSVVSDKKPILSLSESLFAQSLPLQKQNLIAILIPHHILRLGEHTHVYVVARTD